MVWNPSVPLPWWYMSSIWMGIFVTTKKKKDCVFEKAENSIEEKVKSSIKDKCGPQTNTRNIYHWPYFTRGGYFYSPLVFFFLINPFKKIFFFKSTSLWVKFHYKNSWKFQIAKITKSFPVFEVFQNHFPKSEHFLANTYLNLLAANYEYVRSEAFVSWCQLRVYSFVSKYQCMKNYKNIRDFNEWNWPFDICSEKRKFFYTCNTNNSLQK